MKLVFATHNQNKLVEVRLLVPAHIELLSLIDIGCNEDIPETSDTLEGNANLKTRYIKEKYGYDCFADDTGLEVLALNNSPGVYSARYAGPIKDAQANISKLLSELKGITNRDARFITAIALAINDTDKLFLGICNGSITNFPRGKSGFGYDPIFKPKGFNRTFAQMSIQQKSEIGHRGKAIRLLIDFLSE